MIRAIGNKRLNLNNQEFQAYNKIIENVDKTEFNEIFETDKNGNIIAILPPINENISMVVIYFLFNVMINQRVRKIDKLIDEVYNLKKEIKELKKKDGK